LPHVELALRPARAGHADPAEEDFAGGLHQPLSLDHALPVVCEAALAGERLEDRRQGLLDLQEQGILLVASEQEHDTGTHADAPDADDLTGDVDVSIALQ